MNLNKVAEDARQNIKTSIDYLTRVHEGVSEEQRKFVSRQASEALEKIKELITLRKTEKTRSVQQKQTAQVFDMSNEGLGLDNQQIVDRAQEIQRIELETIRAVKSLIEPDVIIDTCDAWQAAAHRADREALAARANAAGIQAEARRIIEQNRHDLRRLQAENRFALAMRNAAQDNARANERAARIARANEQAARIALAKAQAAANKAQADAHAATADAQAVIDKEQTASAAARADAQSARNAKDRAQAEARSTRAALVAAQAALVAAQTALAAAQAEARVTQAALVAAQADAQAAPADVQADVQAALVAAQADAQAAQVARDKAQADAQAAQVARDKAHADAHADAHAAQVAQAAAQSAQVARDKAQAALAAAQTARDKALADLADAKTELKTVQAERDVARQKNSQNAIDIENLKQQVDAQRLLFNNQIHVKQQELTALQEQYRIAQSQYNDTINKLRQKTGDIKTLEKRMADCVQQKQMIEQQKKNNNDTLSEKSAIINALQTEKNELEQRCSRFQQKIKELTDSNQQVIQHAEDVARDYQIEITDLNTKNTQALDKLRIAEQQLADANNQKKQLEEQIQQQRGVIKQLKQSMEEADQQFKVAVDEDEKRATVVEVDSDSDAGADDDDDQSPVSETAPTSGTLEDLYRAEIDALRQQHAEQVEQYNKKLTDAQNQLTLMQQQYDAQTVVIEQLEKQLREAREKITSLEQQLQQAAISQKQQADHNEELQAAYDRQVARVEKLHKQYSKFQNQIKEKDQQIKQLSARCEAITQQNNVMQVTIERYEERTAELENDARENRSQIEELEDSLIDQGRVLDQVNDKNKKLVQQIAAQREAALVVDHRFDAIMNSQTPPSEKAICWLLKAIRDQYATHGKQFDNSLQWCEPHGEVSGEVYRRKPIDQQGAGIDKVNGGGLPIIGGAVGVSITAIIIQYGAVVLAVLIVLLLLIWVADRAYHCSKYENTYYHMHQYAGQNGYR